MKSERKQCPIRPAHNQIQENFFLETLMCKYINIYIDL